MSEVRLCCCSYNRRVYDWDEFSKIEGCTIGRHNCEQKTQSFAPSPTVAAINAISSAAPTPAPAAASTPSVTSAPVTRSIEEYNKQNPNAPTAVKSVEKVIKQKQQPVAMKGMTEFIG